MLFQQAVFFLVKNKRGIQFFRIVYMGQFNAMLTQKLDMAMLTWYRSDTLHIHDDGNINSCRTTFTV